MNQKETAAHRARTKIVATVGPACSRKEQLSELVRAGVDVFRLNAAHETRDRLTDVVRNIRDVEQEHDRSLAILLDLAGPKIRLGELFEDPTHCDMDARYTFIRGDESGGTNEFTSNYDRFIDEISVGDRVMLADGTVSMLVEEVNDETATCRVIGPGTVRSRQGINLPGVKLSVPSLTEADWAYAKWAADNDLDLVGLSFVRTAAEVCELKEFFTLRGSSAMVIAKIEKQEALENLGEIISCADGVMVARGDLGIETEVSEMPVVQKRIVALCNERGRPVIVATQMLDSMQRASRPTRAEVTDVANAILDGADACMLSGETAIGQYPRESVVMMNKIMLSTETTLRDQPANMASAPAIVGVHPITAAVVQGAARIAEQLFANLVVIATRSGATALAKSKQRDYIRTIAVSDDEATLRRMSLFWGIMPLKGAPTLEGAELHAFIDEWGKSEDLLSAGDRVVFVAGSGIEPGTHNQVAVHEVTG